MILLVFWVVTANSGAWAAVELPPDPCEQALAAAAPDGELPKEAGIEALEARLAELERTVVDPNAGLFGPDSMVWKINREMAVFMGAGRAALLQLAHPYVAYAIDQHSKTKTDPTGRFQRTFTFVGAMVFGDWETVKRSAHSLFHIHSRIKGVIPENAGPFKAGSRYAANVPEPAFWVFATLWDTSARMYERLVRRLTAAEKEQFYSEGKKFAALFAIPDSVMPRDWQAFEKYMDEMLHGGLLVGTKPARDIGGFLFEPLFPVPGLGLVMKDFALVTSYLLPGRLAGELGLPRGGAAGRFVAEKSMDSFKAAYRLLPKSVRYGPAYHQAMARVTGREAPSLSLKMSRLMIGHEQNPLERR